MRKQINKTQILATLANIKNGCIVNLTTETAVKMKKTGNPFAENSVTKLARRNVQFGVNYDSSVNARLDRNGLPAEFKAEPLPWGEWVKGEENRIITHKGANYARFYKIAGEVHETYYKDGIVMTEEEVKTAKSFEPAKSVSQTQASAGLTTAQVHPFNVNFDNIREIRFGGDEYEII